MATRKAKAKAKGNRAMIKANETALKGFPKSKLRKALDAMAADTAAVEQADEQRALAALTFVDLAAEFVAKNDGIPTPTLLDGWRDNLAVVVMECAVAGNRFASLTPAEGDKPAKAKLTGYGANVASIAKGVIQFPGIIAEVEEHTYRNIRKAVEAARAAEREASKSDDEKAIEQAIAEFDEQAAALRKLVTADDDIALILGAAEALANMVRVASEQAAEQEALNAEVEQVETMAEFVG